MAVQVAKHLGAGHVIGAGRDAARLASLPKLGADTVIQLGTATAIGDLAHAARDVDVVIDYLWGPITAEAMAGIATHRSDRAKPLTWIEIGSGGFELAARAVPLADVEVAWSDTNSDERIVITP
jgi:Zinc-binding dehydrogenase